MLIFDDYARKIAKYHHDIVTTYLPVVQGKNPSLTIDEILYRGLINFYTVDRNDPNSASLIVQLSTLLMGMYAEFYVATYKRLLFNESSDSERELFQKMDNARNFDDYFKLINHEYANKGFKYMLEYERLTAYAKVLRNHILGDKVEQIYKINPYYESEYQKYNIEINLDFIYRQLSKYYITYNNVDRGLDATISFLKQLRQVDKELLESIVMDLLMGCTEEEKTIILDNPDVDELVLENYKITFADLRILLENYFESQRKNSSPRLLKK